MTVEELMCMLSAMPMHYEVIIQKDAEGNDYSPLAGAADEDCYYEAETTWSGTVYSKEDFADGCGDEETAKPVCVLFPVN
jgi:hypothetical protein